MFLFTGSDRFLLQLELTRRQEGFKKKFGSETIVRYDSQHRDETQIRQDLLGTDLFSPKKCIIIAGVPEDTTKDNTLTASQLTFFDTLLETSSSQINPDHIIILISYTPDKRKKIYKRCKEHIEIKEFTQLAIPDLIPKIVERTGHILDTNLATYLINKVGVDTGRLWHECQKIISRKAHFESQNSNLVFTQATIDTIVFSTKDSDPFGMVDVIFDDPTKACHLLDTMHANNDNRNQVMGAILRGVRNILLYLGCRQEGLESKDIASKLGIHPFVISKLKAKEKNLTEMFSQIKDFFSDLLTIDEGIKTGKLPDVAFWLEVKKAIWTLSTKNTTPK